MTPSELKQKTSETEPHFFTRKTLKFFEDTMANYGCRSTTISGHKNPVWELHRKRPVKHQLQKSAYFDQATFKRVWPDHNTPG